jgi:hypothetical protein
MMPALRRWFARHPARWVLAVTLGMSLSGAQVVAACHEISHLFGRGGAGVVATAKASAPDDHGGSAVGTHDCPLCLIAAALGGTATAPDGPALPAADDAATAPPATAHDFTPRFTRVYASRAPPRATPAA